MLERALGDISQFTRNPVLVEAWDRFTDVRKIASDAELHRRSLDTRFPPS